MVRSGKPGRRRTWNGKRKTRLSRRVKSSQEGKMRGTEEEEEDERREVGKVQGKERKKDRRKWKREKD